MSRERITIKKQGRQWGIYLDGELIEGGFFDRGNAEDAAAEYSGALILKAKENDEEDDDE